jgi:hypothetical protein
MPCRKLIWLAGAPTARPAESAAVVAGRTSVSRQAKSKDSIQPIARLRSRELVEDEALTAGFI